MQLDQNNFIHQKLAELADEYQIPASMTEDLFALMQEYPSLEGKGRLNDLTNELEKIFQNAEDAGHIQTQ